VKKIILVVLALCLVLPGCSTMSGMLGGSGTETVSIDQTATDSLTAIGSVLSKVPATADALFAAGTINKEQYNQVVDLYTKAKAMYIVAVNALEVKIAAGNDPNKDAAYSLALGNLNAINIAIQNLLLSFAGGK
jgi:hypothetical protein